MQQGMNDSLRSASGFLHQYRYQRPCILAQQVSQCISRSANTIDALLYVDNGSLHGEQHLIDTRKQLSCSTGMQTLARMYG